MEEEIWKDIPNLEGYCQISNLGRVKSLERTYVRSDNVQQIKKERFLSSATGIIYPTNKNGKRVHVNIHSLVKKLFIQQKPVVDLEGEVWKDIKGYEGLYKISNLGRIKTLERKVMLDDVHYRLAEERILSPDKTRIHLQKDGIGERISIRLLLSRHFPKKIEDLPNEEWMDITEYDGYQISDMGRIKSKERYVSNGDNKRKIVHEKIRKLSSTPSGYLQVNFTDKIRFAIHRLVAKYFVPNPEKKPWVNHIDGNKQNNVASNLEWVSEKENSQHAVQTGLMLQGEKHPSSKLTEKDVRFIRIYHKSRDKEFSAYALAKKFGVSHSTIIEIVQGIIWKHVQ